MFENIPGGPQGGGRAPLNLDTPRAKAHAARMFMTTLHVAAGGAIGAALRFLMGVCVLKATATTNGSGFPLAVISVNILGSFAMGLFVVFAAKTSNTHLNPFVMTGILGGFTTFSAFSLEAYTLFERGQTAAAATYVGASVVLSIAGLVAGIAIARGIWA